MLYKRQIKNIAIADRVADRLDRLRVVHAADAGLLQRSHARGRSGSQGNNYGATTWTRARAASSARLSSITAATMTNRSIRDSKPTSAFVFRAPRCSAAGRPNTTSLYSARTTTTPTASPRTICTRAPRCLPAAGSAISGNSIFRFGTSSNSPGTIRCRSTWTSGSSSRATPARSG